MAKIISVANSKGGVSKSSLVLFIYQYLQSIGGDVVMLDRDEQRTITDLSNRLGKGLRIIDPDDLDEIHSLPYEFIISDTPPYKSDIWDKLFFQSDFILIPMKPTFFDLMAVETIIDEISQYEGKKYAVVLTQVRHGVGFNNDILTQLKEKGIPVLNTKMYQRVAYTRGVLYDNLGAEQDAKAEKEMADITAEILTKIAG